MRKRTQDKQDKQDKKDKKVNRVLTNGKICVAEKGVNTSFEARKDIRQN